MPQKTTREDWIETGLALLEAEGWGSLGIAAAATRLKVPSHCFYDHFTDRQDWFAALLAYWEFRAFASLARPDAASAAEAGLLGLTRAVMEWARFHDKAAAALSRLQQEARPLPHSPQRAVA